ncbi:Hsp20/alpha crystallin family protein [Leekyejoonella antrihumi]|uniref:Hsp20/alpha crystallin family protein n=1 Tax=Leekyejoonella antrihumi TaxID=1660198 RepID=A0A563E1F5_9MICO|nr:Hsp20/alpha crystallin family protein [Leekyejoonella antrihumi]TWP36225.1 Hsp20/alpha crystallin family protein [Leekyejoonella antrihumi]
MSMTMINQRSAFPEFDALIRGAFGPGTAPSTTGFTPAAEVRRDGDDAVVSLEVPGVDIDRDVTVEVDRSRLVVRGERRREEKDGGGLREMRYGSFRRSFSLPSHVTADAVSATYDAGLLHIRVTDVYKGTEPQKISIASTAPTAAPVQATDGEQSEQE